MARSVTSSRAESRGKRVRKPQSNRPATCCCTPRAGSPKISRREAIKLGVAFASVATGVVTLPPAPAYAGTDPDLPNPTPNPTLIPAGSLIVPMDTTSQALVSPFNMKAYGLIHKLLNAGIPVMWAIRAGKGKDGIDFSAAASRVLPSAISSATINFSGGPFIVHSAFASAAMPLMTAYGNSVAVYSLTNATTIDIRYSLTFRPTIAVGMVNSQIHTQYLTEAGITNYTVIDVASGLLNSGSCFSIVTEAHTTDTSGVPAVTTFLNSGGNLFCECAAIINYEQLDNKPPTTGNFQTTTGYVTLNDTTNNANAIQYSNPDLAVNQFVGTLSANTGGSVPDFGLPLSGGGFQNNTFILDSQAVDKNGYTPILVSQGKLLAGTRGSNVFYLGGHDWGNQADITTMNGRRVYNNALLVPTLRTGCPDIEFGAAVGIVFVDKNRNGQYDTGEVGLAGVTVTLVGTGGTFTTTTDANGNYGFAAPPGSYKITATLSAAQIAAGYVLSTPSTNPQNVTLTSTVITTAAPIGYDPPAPAITLIKTCSSVAGNGCATGNPGDNLTYTITFTNAGHAAASGFVIIDPIVPSAYFEVGSATAALGTTGLTVAIAYSQTVVPAPYNPSSYVFGSYTPVSGGGGAPPGYDATVTAIRWTFSGSLSQTAPNNTGSASLTNRIA